MKLIVCIDKKGGRMFGNRRQSQDRVLRERVLSLCAGKQLWMSTYSAGQFTDGGDFTVDDDYASKAGEDDFCFVEDGSLPLDMCQTLVLYHWNRQYPSTLTLDMDPKSAGFRLESKTDFVGSSHEKITEEIYVR